MRLQDVTLLSKKILVGLALVLVPLVILFGGLRTTQRLLKTKPQTQQSSLQPR